MTNPLEADVQPDLSPSRIDYVADYQGSPALFMSLGKGSDYGNAYLQFTSNYHYGNRFTVVTFPAARSPQDYANGGNDFMQPWKRDANTVELERFQVSAVSHFDHKVDSEFAQPEEEMLRLAFDHGKTLLQAEHTRLLTQAATLETRAIERRGAAVRIQGTINLALPTRRG